MPNIKDHEQEIFERVCQTLNDLSDNIVITMLAEFTVKDSNKLFEVVRRRYSDIKEDDDIMSQTRYILALYMGDKIYNPIVH